MGVGVVAQVISDSSLRAAGGHDPEPRGLLNVGGSEDSPKSSSFWTLGGKGRGHIGQMGKLEPEDCFGCLLKRMGQTVGRRKVRMKVKSKEKGKGPRVWEAGLWVPTEQGEVSCVSEMEGGEGGGRGSRALQKWPLLSC